MSFWNKKPKPKFYLRDAKRNKRHQCADLDTLLLAYECYAGEDLSKSLVYMLKGGASVFSGPRWYLDVAGAPNTLSDADAAEIWRNRNG